MNNSAVTLKDVSKRYRGDGEQTITALDSVSITIAAGSIVAIMGPSGSGKSTLLHLVGAMDRADEGTIRVGDTDVTTLSSKEQAPFRRQIGFVFQRFHLLPALNVRDNIASPLLPRPSSFDKFGRARELAAAVGLAGREDALPSHLSGGEQQRVAIARALINRPRLLLADEPTGNLDSKTSTEIMDLLMQLREQHGMTILVATHDPTIAERCDYRIELQDGRVVDAAATPAATPPFQRPLVKPHGLEPRRTDRAVDGQQ